MCRRNLGELTARCLKLKGAHPEVRVVADAAYAAKAWKQQAPQAPS
jgi:hypothetical protein